MLCHVMCHVQAALHVGAGPGAEAADHRAPRLPLPEPQHHRAALPPGGCGRYYLVLNSFMFSALFCVMSCHVLRHVLPCSVMNYVTICHVM